MIVNYIRNVAADKYADSYHQSMGILVQLKTRESSEGCPSPRTYSLTHLLTHSLTHSLTVELLKNLEEVFELAIASFRIIYTSEFTYINFHVLPPADRRDTNDTTGNFAHSLTYSLTYSITHLLTHLLTHLFRSNNELCGGVCQGE